MIPDSTRFIKDSLNILKPEEYSQDIFLECSLKILKM